MTNQTPESVIAEAMVNAGAPLMHSRVDEGVAAALRAANMLREPGVPDAATESLRREAAVLELRNRYGQSNGTQTWIEFQGDPHFIVNQVLAALDGAPVIDEAAAGVAPQAESVPTSSYISPHLPGMIRNLWKSDPSENSVRTALKLAGDLIQELIDLRAANMLLEPGGPDAANEELARIKPLFENYSREYPNECNKRVKAEAERDAGLAAIERVRAVVKSIRFLAALPPFYEGNTVMNAAADDIIAALDGAPEPEREYVGMAFEHGGFMRIRNDQLVPEKFESWRKLVAQYPRVEILKRVKAVPAGPWLPVEGESE